MGAETKIETKIDLDYRGGIAEKKNSSAVIKTGNIII